MVRVTYILSNINKALAFEWIAENLDKEKFKLSFILLNPDNSELENYLLKNEVNVNRVLYRGKKDLIRAVSTIYNLLKREKSHIVHCHLFDASIAGLFAAKAAGIKKRIYTRHHATFHQVYFPRAVWYDKMISTMATDVVAISENVKNTLTGEGVNPNKIHLIHHGFKLQKFEHVDQSTIIQLKQKFNPSRKYPVIGVISRYFELKGIQYIIPAFKCLLQYYPEALLILANANGNYTSQINLLLQDIPESNYLEIPFEQNIFALYHLFDIFIHAPIDSSVEAFGQTYVEALAAGIPSIFTMSGIARELIVDKRNALVVNFKDSHGIYEAMNELLQNAHLREQLSKQGKKDVKVKFELHTMINKLEKIYSN